MRIQTKKKLELRRLALEERQIAIQKQQICIIPTISTSYTSQQSFLDLDSHDTMAYSNAEKSQYNEAGIEMMNFDGNRKKNRTYPR